MKFHVVAAAILALGTTSALAQDADGEAAETQAAPTAQQEDDAEVEDDRGSEVVCRTERVTGSLTRRTRTCLTRDEWDLVESRTKDALDRMGRNASGSQCIPDDPFRGRC